MSAAEEIKEEVDPASAQQEPLPTVLRCCGRGCGQRYWAEAMWTERVETEMVRSFPRLMADWIFREEAYCPRCRRPGMRSLKREYARYVRFLMSTNL